MKKAAILQSNYIPWKGYFDMIAAVDEFILYDHVQYTKNDWRNRNKIKTPRGVEWLTIPVIASGHFGQRICDTETTAPGHWARKHWKSIELNYSRAPFFRDYSGRFSDFYLGLQESNLSKINFSLITIICEILGIKTRLSWSMDYQMVEGKTERLVGLCQAVTAQHYLSGPAAQDYLEPDRFAEAGVALEYMDYSGYPEYPQLHGQFEHGVSVIDLIFNTGPEAPRYMKFVN